MTSISAPPPAPQGARSRISPLATRVTPRAVAEWEAHLGAPTAAGRPRPVHYSGAAGTQAYGHSIEVRVPEPEGGFKRSVQRVL
ncbi:hypothetical protein [Gordonia shandongensis]|uniref:hypothetical protein n=1 Tax=Gordonia shandongensis TaxID=376351 RepID=UPI0004250EE0|nr:hypothetical protein [Gordonia shandongensis]